MSESEHFTNDMVVVFLYVTKLLVLFSYQRIQVPPVKIKINFELPFHDHFSNVFTMPSVYLIL